MMLSQKPQRFPFRPLSLAARYALIAAVAHAAVITISLFPGARAAPILEGDAVTYWMDAQNLVRSGKFSRQKYPPFLWEPYRTPGYPGLMASAQLLTGDYRLTLYYAALTAGLAAWSAVRLVEYWGGGQRAQRAAGWLVSLLPNSLGLSAWLLTDAIAGHLFLFWVYQILLGLRAKSRPRLVTSAVCAVILQFLKPTFFAIGLLALLAILCFAGQWKIQSRIVLAFLYLGFTALFPLFSALRIYQDHGVLAANLLGIETIREYLQAQYLAETTHQSVSQAAKEIRAADWAAADRQKGSMSIDGKLYLARRKEIQRFLKEHPLDAIRLMTKEAIRQAAAPQEFVFMVFFGNPPRWVRVVGSLLTIALWILCGYQVFWQIRAGHWHWPFFAVLAAAFFVATGSVSHFVGARLRFPADMLIIILAAQSIETMQIKFRRKTI